MIWFDLEPLKRLPYERCSWCEPAKMMAQNHQNDGRCFRDALRHVKQIYNLYNQLNWIWGVSKNGVNHPGKNLLVD